MCYSGLQEEAKEENNLKSKEKRKTDRKREHGHRSIFGLGSLPLCMRNSKAEVFLSSSLVVGIQCRPLWVHKTPPLAVEMVESALPRSQKSDRQRGRRSESGLRRASEQGATEVLLVGMLCYQLLRVELARSKFMFMGSFLTHT